MRTRMMLVLRLALAGALGALARFAIGDWKLLRTANTFPWGTLLINVVGSFVLAFALRQGETGALSRESRAVIGIGCGPREPDAPLGVASASQFDPQPSMNGSPQFHCVASRVRYTSA